ncbi:hypothetical protein [Clostridium beijerinckii]|uniref:hypothetical protein n=1 Tax=Clostridium beijerinckii TaxID=1520 RepID=UPI00156EFA90|nr:hypothetical protein [Clostridium beijerinckii]NRU52575.1 hypothetical protein [Clostridium beijerinckii]NYC69248.1 hypothetical protein [Clostridium beijerinckii]NYC91776.1 hypothetical protein [Clostridium beijerinckii]
MYGVVRYPALGVRVVEIQTNKGVLGMSIYTMLLLGFITICLVAVIALSPFSKTCKFDTKFNTTGFNFTFETNEKGTPSDER